MTKRPLEKDHLPRSIPSKIELLRKIEVYFPAYLVVKRDVISAVPRWSTRKELVPITALSVRNTNGNRFKGIVNKKGFLGGYPLLFL